jgi:hypothetical protein
MKVSYESIGGNSVLLVVSSEFRRSYSSLSAFSGRFKLLQLSVANFARAVNFRVMKPFAVGPCTQMRDFLTV